MSLVVPKYRVMLDDTVSVKDPLVLGLMQVPSPSATVMWDLMPFGDPVSGLDFKTLTRTKTARTAALASNFATNATTIVLSSGTKKSVTSGNVLYHTATKQGVVLGTETSTSGTWNVRKVLVQDGGSRAQIDSGSTVEILATSEDYVSINQTSRQESTVEARNYVQDTIERIDLSVADLREGRKEGIDQKTYITERMSDIMSDLSRACYYNIPCAYSASETAVTAGFDYLCRKAGGTVDANASGTADLDDVKGVLKTLAKNGVSSEDGLVAMMSPNVFWAYEKEGVDQLNIQGMPGSEFVSGNVMKGLTLSGLGFVPFYFDPKLNDDVVRFVSTKYAKKRIYKGSGEGAILEGLSIQDEASLSTSRLKVSTMQIKWATDISLAGTVHYLLEGTGLN